MNPVTQFFLIPVSPIGALAVAGVLLILLECVSLRGLKPLKLLVAYLGPIAAIYLTWWMGRHVPAGFSLATFTGPENVWLQEFVRNYKLDTVTLTFYWAINIFLFFSVLFLQFYFEGEEQWTEILILAQFIACGMMVLVSANSLLMIFMGLELMSLPTYVLVGMHQRDVMSSEGALKYFLFGSFATVLLLFAIALIYAQMGTLQLSELAQLVQSSLTPVAQGSSSHVLIYASSALFIIAVGFKVGIFPFHMWLPDAYEGAPAPVTGFMGSAVKLAGFALILRLFWGLFLAESPHWTSILGVLAILTMFLGNLAALLQDNLKRMFAYSSISHAGYLLLGVTAFLPPLPDSTNLFYYLVVYGFMFLGLFAVLTLIERQKKSTEITDIAGMGFSHPWLGACLVLFALSAAGIPPTAGFFAKYFVFLQAVRAGHTGWVVLAVISSIIGVYYYLRVIVYLYMKEGREPLRLSGNYGFVMIGILACAFCMLYFSAFPGRLGM